VSKPKAPRLSPRRLSLVCDPYRTSVRTVVIRPVGACTLGAPNVVNTLDREADRPLKPIVHAVAENFCLGDDQKKRSIEDVVAPAPITLERPSPPQSPCSAWMTCKPVQVIREAHFALPLPYFRLPLYAVLFCRNHIVLPLLLILGAAFIRPTPSAGYLNPVAASRRPS
jgi:hypothetical protein